MDQQHQRRTHDPDLWATGSPAAIDAADAPVADRVKDLLGFVNLAVGVALDNSDYLAAAGAAAAEGAPTHIYVPASAGRSTLEILGRAYWLLEPGLTARHRAGRILTIRRSEITSQMLLNIPTDTPSNAADRVAHVDNLADILGLRKSNRDRQVSFGEPVPRLAELVRGIVTDGWIYSVLSAVAHGELWALRQWGYVATEERPSDGIRLLRKAPPAAGMEFVLTTCLSGLSRLAVREAEYRGWDAPQMTERVQEAMLVASGRRQAPRVNRE